MLAFLFVFGSFLFAFLSFVFFQFQMLTACVLVWRAWCRHVRLNLTIRRPRLRWPDCVSWRRLQPTHPLFAQNVIPSTVSGSLISSCLFFISTTCVWYSYHFLPLWALPVCGTPISSFLCQQCLCVVFSSVPFFVSSVCVWFSHHFQSLSALPVYGTLITSSVVFCLFVFSTAWGLLTKATFFPVCSPTIYLHFPCP